MPTDIYGYDCCPVRRLNYQRALQGRDRQHRQRLYGIEVEMDNFDEYEAEEADSVWTWLQDDVLGKSIADAYYLPTEDGSIRARSGEGVELKTVPLTKTEHTLYHWLFTNKEGRSDKVPTTYRKAVREMDRSTRRRWFPSGGAWTNRSCGMHITVSEQGVSRLTWCKTLYWINKIALYGMHKTLFLRQPTSYCNVYPVSLTPVRPEDETEGSDFSSYSRIRQVFNGDYECRQEDLDAMVGYEKYSQLRVKPRGLVEFRGFRSSLNPLMMLRNIEVVESIIDLMEVTPILRLDSLDDWGYGLHVGKNSHHYPFLRRWFVSVAKNSPMKRGFFCGAGILTQHPET